MSGNTGSDTAHQVPSAVDTAQGPERLSRKRKRELYHAQHVHARNDHFEQVLDEHNRPKKYKKKRKQNRSQPSHEAPPHANQQALRAALVAGSPKALAYAGTEKESKHVTVVTYDKHYSTRREKRRARHKRNRLLGLQNAIVSTDAPTQLVPDESGGNDESSLRGSGYSERRAVSSQSKAVESTQLARSVRKNWNVSVHAVHPAVKAASKTQLMRPPTKTWIAVVDPIATAPVGNTGAQPAIPTTTLFAHQGNTSVDIAPISDTREQAEPMLQKQQEQAPPAEPNEDTSQINLLGSAPTEGRFTASAETRVKNFTGLGRLTSVPTHSTTKDVYLSWLKATGGDEADGSSSSDSESDTDENKTFSTSRVLKGSIHESFAHRMFVSSSDDSAEVNLEITVHESGSNHEEEFAQHAMASMSYDSDEASTNEADSNPAISTSLNDSAPIRQVEARPDQRKRHAIGLEHVTARSMSARNDEFPDEDLSLGSQIFQSAQQLESEPLEKDEHVTNTPPISEGSHGLRAFYRSEDNEPRVNSDDRDQFQDALRYNEMISPPSQDLDGAPIISRLDPVQESMSAEHEIAEASLAKATVGMPEQTSLISTNHTDDIAKRATGSPGGVPFGRPPGSHTRLRAASKTPPSRHALVEQEEDFDTLQVVDDVASNLFADSIVTIPERKPHSLSPAGQDRVHLMTPFRSSRTSQDMDKLDLNEAVGNTFGTSVATAANMDEGDIALDHSADSDKESSAWNLLEAEETERLPARRNVPRQKRNTSSASSLHPNPRPLHERQNGSESNSTRPRHVRLPDEIVASAARGSPQVLVTVNKRRATGLSSMHFSTPKRTKPTSRAPESANVVDECETNNATPPTLLSNETNDASAETNLIAKSDVAKPSRRSTRSRRTGEHIATSESKAGLIPDAEDVHDSEEKELEIPETPGWAAINHHSVTLQQTRPSIKKKTPKSSGTLSSYFIEDRVDLYNTTSGNKRRVPAGTSAVPAPSINADKFGIIQEKLWKEPFWLLVVVQLLNKTTGRAAVPVFRKIQKRYQTAEGLAAAEHADVLEMIGKLGLQNSRTKGLIQLARIWAEDPPVAGKLHRKRDYPRHGDGKAVDLPEKIIERDMPECRGAIEIGHLYGCGAYAYDSWRIFCRDVLRGVAEDYKGSGAEEEDFEPEWKRVVPGDKELRACLRWMWLKEGYIWDPLTGDKRRATDEEMKRAVEGEMEIADQQERKFAAQAAGEASTGASMGSSQQMDETPSKKRKTRAQSTVGNPLALDMESDAEERREDHVGEEIPPATSSSEHLEAEDDTIQQALESALLTTSTRGRRRSLPRSAKVVRSIEASPESQQTRRRSGRLQAPASGVSTLSLVSARNSSNSIAGESKRESTMPVPMAEVPRGRRRKRREEMDSGWGVGGGGEDEDVNVAARKREVSVVVLD